MIILIWYNYVKNKVLKIHLLCLAKVVSYFYVYGESKATSFFGRKWPCIGWFWILVV